MPPLLSGNGRHRRPRQAPNFVLAAGVTGAGLAIPLLGATAANAADAKTWDAVADCESGGLWSTNEDNGYYGGLQLDQETWEEHGGTEYAERPDLASRDQQITVAERVLDAEGTDSFGDCAQSAGLSQDSPSPDVDPDGSGEVADGPVAERPYPPAPSTPSTGAPEDESGAPDSGGSADPTEPTDPTDPADPADPADSADPPAEPPAPGDQPAGDDGRPSRDDSDGRGGSGGSGAGGSAGKDGAAGKDDAAGKKGQHRVSHGDSLYTIADEEDVAGGWQKLYERNRDVIGSDPDLIIPGQELRL